MNVFAGAIPRNNYLHTKGSLGSVNRAETFESLFVLEYPKMVALAAAVSGDRSQAEDIAQDAMTKLSKNWETVRYYDKPGAWLRRVTIHLSLSSKRRFLSESKALFGLRQKEVTLKQATSEDQEIWEHVKSLPKMQRSVVALRYLEGHSLEHIATILKIKPSTARVHLHRARQSLHKKLSHALETTND